MLLATSLVLAFFAPDRGIVDAPPGETATAILRREATALQPLVKAKLTQDFLKATSRLPAISARRLFFDEAKKAYLSDATAGSLSESDRRTLKPVSVDESLYYTTKYGSPLAYARPLDLLGEAGLDDVSSRKILDFGYGTVGHLRLLASLGADVTGVDVDPLLPALYGTPGDQGIVANAGGRDGRIRLIDGRFPVSPAIRSAVGGNYDLIISKNTLKRGYVHPDRPVDARRLLNLGVDDRQFVTAFFEALKPGGRVLIYNISPAPSPPEEPYKNWADGRCPFAKEVWEAVGFQVIAFDRDDTEAIRRFAHALGWDRGESPMDLNTDVFARYSMLQRPLKT